MMKKNVWLLMAALFMFAFAACSDDDKDDSTIAERLAGAYTGTIRVYQLSETGEAENQIGEPLENQTIRMEATAARNLTLVLENFQFSNLITVKRIAIPVTIGTDDRTITGETDGIEVFPGITASAAVTGTLAGGKADLSIDVTAPLMPGKDPVKMLVKFAGNRK